MRKIFYLLAIISAILFIYSTAQLSRQFSQPALPHLGEVKGFDDSNEGGEYKQLLDKFGQRIQAANDEAKKDQTLYFWMSFIVTTLTAGSTLVSSIQAAKKDPSPDPKRTQLFAIVIAILTFCSTLANFASTHFNELKTEETKKSTDLVTMRNQFYADYENTSEAKKPSVIQDYSNRLG
jgi:hypothetical protein